MAISKQERSKIYYKNNTERIKKAVTEYRNKNRNRVNEMQRNRHYINNYGITIEQRNELIAKQNGLCAVCNEPGKLFVDHDHNTGSIRGMIHNHCNRGIGWLDDTVESVELALAYLKRHYGNN